MKGTRAAAGLASLAVLLLTSLAPLSGCGSSGTSGGAGISDASTGGTSASGGASSGGASGSSSGGASGGQTNTGGAAEAGSCPDVFGSFTVASVGQGCGDLNTSAPQCIKGTTSVCALHFYSVLPDGGTAAVNGGATLGADGTFSGAAIILGTVQRTGCVGAWNASTSTMSVTCGGTGTSQSCTANLTRTSNLCP